MIRLRRTVRCRRLGGPRLEAHPEPVRARPFCAVRCGYCSLTRYTMEQLGTHLPRGLPRRTPPRRSTRTLGARAPPGHRRGLPRRLLGGDTPTLLPAQAAPCCTRRGERAGAGRGGHGQGESGLRRAETSTSSPRPG
ncbi:hypothetical protein QJS66_03700 [Kocuria rhizophila]|nr:hypothetical protein QJS66_03700 [Kocuria rhizophila]